MARIGDFIKRRPVVSALVGGAIVLGGASAVSAQYGGWGGGSGGWGHGGRMMGGPGRMLRMCAMDTKRWHPVMQAWVKADLNLDANQAAAFDKLVAVAQPAMEQIKGEVCANFGPTAPKLAPPERLEKAATTMRKAADAMTSAVEPAKTFYGTLNDQQKARVELLMERRRGMGRRMGRGGGEDRRGWHHRRDDDDRRGRWSRGDRNGPRGGAQEEAETPSAPKN